MAETNEQVICTDGAATLLVPTPRGTRKLTFTPEDIPTLVHILHHLVNQKETN